jgi:hypothetical protein
VHPDGNLRADPLASIVAAEARSQASSTASKVAALEEDVAHLLMVVEALWEIVKTEHDFDDTELLRRVVEIDLRDGKLDGRAPKKPAADCSHCGRKMMGRKPVCIYCGKPSLRDVFAR